jgi:CRP-like cAMP-binding protein
MPGDSFGEMALLLSDNTRNATIKTEVSTVFATLDKGSFD